MSNPHPHMRQIKFWAENYESLVLWRWGDLYFQWKTLYYPNVPHWNKMADYVVIPKEMIAEFKEPLLKGNVQFYDFDTGKWLDLGNRVPDFSRDKLRVKPSSKIEITVKVDGVPVPIRQISEDELLEIRRNS